MPWPGDADPAILERRGSLKLHSYRTRECAGCPLKPRCTPAQERRVKRWEHEAVLDATQERLDRAPGSMRIRRQTAEHPFGIIKAWMGSTHFRLCTLEKVSAEPSRSRLQFEADDRHPQISLKKSLIDCRQSSVVIHRVRLICGRDGDDGGSGDAGAAVYDFCLDDHVPFDHLLRGVDRHLTLDDLRQSLKPFYSQMGRPSVDPELMIRMLVVGYCMGIRSERRLCEEVHLNLTYRWFCRLGLDGRVPDHSTFSKNRHGRFRESDALRRLFESVVQRCIAEGLVSADGFAVTPA